MSRSKQSRGTCAFCGREMTRSGMSRHLMACPERQAAIDASRGGPGQAQPLYHLQVQDADGGTFWLHLEMNGWAQLVDLDSYLRAIWLECCGHMSMFSWKLWDGSEIPMKSRAHELFQKGMELTHVYDFGTDSVTQIRVVDVRRGRPLSEHPIFLMARNKQPDWRCQECGEPADWLCLECAYETDQPGVLCSEHAESHPHDAYGLPMPLVNSPRVGMCGYTGPAEPPY